MPYPSVIDGSPDAFFSVQSKPVADGATLWFVGFNTLSEKLLAYKSSDAGLTWDAPIASAGTYSRIYGVADRNGVLYVVASATGSNEVTVLKFSLALEVWTDEIATGETFVPSGSMGACFQNDTLLFCYFCAGVPNESRYGVFDVVAETFTTWEQASLSGFVDIALAQSVRIVSDGVRLYVMAYIFPDESVSGNTEHWCVVAVTNGIFVIVLSSQKVVEAAVDILSGDDAFAAACDGSIVNLSVVYFDGAVISNVVPTSSFTAPVADTPVFVQNDYTPSVGYSIMCDVLILSGSVVLISRNSPVPEIVAPTTVNYLRVDSFAVETLLFAADTPSFNAAMVCTTFRGTSLVTFGSLLFWSLAILPVVGVLAGGAASTPVDLYGSFIGVKRRREC